MLGRYGVAMATGRLVPFDEAVAMADTIGYPIAVKALRRRPGRSAQAGVALDLGRADDVRRAVAVIREHLGDDADHVLVQEMVPPGVDLRIQVVAEGDLGPVVTVGLGGAHAEAIGDESSRLAPVSSASARSMLDETRGGRGARARHRGARRRRDRAGRATGLGSPCAGRARPQPGDPRRQLVRGDRRHRADQPPRARRTGDAPFGVSPGQSFGSGTSLTTWR